MKAVIKINNSLKRVDEFIIYTCIIVVSIILVGNVMGRTFMQHSITWAEEVCTNIMIILTFVGTSYCARMSCHIYMSAIFDALPFKLKKCNQYIISIGVIIGLSAICFYAIIYIMNLIKSGRFTPSLRIPLWIIYLFIPYGLISTIMQHIITIYLNITDKDNVHQGVEQIVDESVDMSDEAIARDMADLEEAGGEKE